MPKIKKIIPIPKNEVVPPGLILICDALERIPERGEALLDYEIQRRERERILMQETKNLLSWHPWHTIRFLLLSGAIAFGITWFISFLSAIGRVYDASIGKLDMGTSILSQKFAAIGSLIPSSAFSIFSKIPDFGAIESFFVALGVVFLVALVKLIFIIVHWKKIKLLGEADDIFAKELETLERWRRELGDEKVILEKSLK
jgi:hypothetical protein